MVRPRAFERPFEAETATFGSWLRRQREAREVSLREIADKTKISFRYLEAMEEDRFDLLPAAVFARGFLREYARYVGLNPDEVLNSFLAAQQSQAQSMQQRAAGNDGAAGPSPEPPSHPERTLSPTALAVSAVAAVVVIALLVAWLLWRQPAENETSAAGSESSTSAATTAGVDPTTASPIATVPTPSPQNTAPPAVVPNSALRLALDFTGDCWVEARVDGKSRVSEKRVQGESLEIEAEREIQLTLGDAGVVEAHLNGQPYALPRERGSVVRRTIDLASLGTPRGADEAR